MILSRGGFYSGVFFALFYIVVTLISVDTRQYYLLFELVLTIFLLLLLFLREGDKKLPVLFYVLTLVTLSVICSALIIGPASFKYDAHYIFYYLLCLIIFAYLYIARLSTFQLISFVNTVYLIYIGLTLFFWIYEISTPTFNVSTRHTLAFLGLEKSILVGLDGSPSSIDAFSGLVLLLNLYFNFGAERKFFIVLPFVAMLLAWRLTPLVAICFTAIVYYFVRSRFLWGATLISVLLVLASVYVYSYVVMQAIEYSFPSSYSLLYKATHARSVIWGQQIAIFTEHYGLSEYLLGGFQNRLFEVPLFQVNGDIIERYTFNSHSSLLLLFLRNPFLFFFFLTTFVLLNIKHFRRENGAITFFILLCLTMNSSLLASGNIIFTIVLISLLIPVNKSR